MANEPGDVKAGGRLYVVAVPIGDPKDITLRALEVLRSVQTVVCEESREGSKLLKMLGIERPLVELNEHNERTQAQEIADRLRRGEVMALVSDCGTPVFADPGRRLFELLASSEVQVVPIPGPSSLMAALSVCHFDMRRFLFGGFPARVPDERLKELRSVKETGLPVVLMDAPYRLAALLRDVASAFGQEREVVLACDMTLPEERIYRGSVEAVQKQTGERKGEFVLIVGPAPGPAPAEGTRQGSRRPRRPSSRQS